MSAAPTKICIVNPFEHGGGAEYQIALLIGELVQSGRYAVHFLTHFVDRPDRPRRYQVQRIGDGGPIPRLGYITEARSLYRSLAALAPDVIYQRVACAYTGVCAYYSRRRGIPMVWHVAHDTEVTPTHLEHGRNRLRVKLEKWAVEAGIRRATRIVVQTRHQAQLLQENYGRAAVEVIPNFQPPATEAIDKSGPLTVLWIANLKPWKRPEAFVRLAQRLQARSDVRFVMVGAAAADNPPWQQRLLRDIESAPNLDYVGEKSQQEVNELLSRAHIFVNTSTHEGFPNTFIQSWFRDVAVVSLDVDPDGLLEGRGLGVLARTETALEDRTAMLIDQPAVRAGFERRGREHARTFHSMDNARRLMGHLEP